MQHFRSVGPDFIPTGYEPGRGRRSKDLGRVYTCAAPSPVIPPPFPRAPFFFPRRDARFARGIPFTPPVKFVLMALQQLLFFYRGGQVGKAIPFFLSECDK